VRILAYHLLEALKIALRPRQVGSFALFPEKSILLQLYRHSAASARVDAGLAEVGERRCALLIVPADWVRNILEWGIRDVILPRAHIAEDISRVIKNDVEDDVHSAGMYRVNQGSQLIVRSLGLSAKRGSARKKS